jgi:hypothetical protein
LAAVEVIDDDIDVAVLIVVAKGGSPPHTPLGQRLAGLR